MKLRTVGKIAGFGIICFALLFAGIELWIASGTSVSLVVHLTGDASIDPVRVSLCGSPVSLSRINRTTYRYDARWLFKCSWAELSLDILSPSGKVRHHQLCYYDGMLETDAVAKIAPDKLALKCSYH